ncbi:MAG: hypothetical protein ACK51N_05985 [bacterium]|nr:hypothetical protein [Phycisphaerales bacterium]
MQTFVNRAAGCWPKGGTRAVRGAAWRPGRTTVIVLLLAVLLLLGGVVTFVVLRYGYFGPNVPRRSDWPEARREHLLKVVARLGGRQTLGEASGWDYLQAAVTAHLAAHGAAGVDVSRSGMVFDGPLAHSEEQIAAYILGFREAGGMASLDLLASGGPGVQPLSGFLVDPFRQAESPTRRPILSSVRDLARALAYDIRRAGTSGSEVVAHARRLAALSASAVQDGNLLDGLMSIAVADALDRAVIDRALSAARLQPSELAEIRKVLSQAGHMSLGEALEGERLAIRQLIDDVVSDSPLKSKSRSAQISAVEAFFAWAQSVIDRPPAERRMLAAGGFVSGAEPRSVAAMVIPSTHKMFQSSERVASSRAATILALAALEFQARHGRLPQALAELVPEFLQAIPLDPVNDEPFVYALADAPAGFTIVSLGEDGKPNVRPGDGDDLVLVPPRKD